MSVGRDEKLGGEKRGTWPWTLSVGGVLVRGITEESGEAAQDQARQRLAKGTVMIRLCNVNAAAWGNTCGWGGSISSSTCPLLQGESVFHPGLRVQGDRRGIFEASLCRLPEVAVSSEI